MVQITEDIELIIGLDVGHGETAASFYNVKNKEKDDLDILPNSVNKAIPSAVAIIEQEGKETICIGQAAIDQAPYAKDFQISFKKRPSKMNAIERKRMVYFMRGVYDAILDRHPDYKTRKHVVYIARPSQDKIWKCEEEAYIKIAEDAGIPIAGIQKESRAAYFRARTQPDSKIDNKVKDGVLIVDYGSSTIDFTYLNKHLTNTIDDGCNLGASEVERLLLEYAMTNPQDSNMLEFVKLYGNDKDSIPYQQMLFKFRAAKEEFYGGKLLGFSPSFNYGLLTCSEGSPITGWGGITLRRSEVNKILGENTRNGYIERVKDAVKRFRDETLKDNKVAYVYLTGGASRMDFVRQIFMDIFQLDENHCLFDGNPSLIVAQGVAHLSYADLQTKEEALKLKHKIHERINEFPWHATISEIIRDSVKAKIKSAAHSIMLDWRDGRIYEVNSAGDKRRNLKALKKAFENLFISFDNKDFAMITLQIITENLIKSIVSEVKKSFKDYNYDPSKFEPLTLPKLEARLKQSGIRALTTKFTADGKGHIIYDSIASRNLFMLDHLNLEAERFDGGRESHYREYPYNIYSDEEWKSFLDEHLAILGIESAKKQTDNYVNAIIDDYVSFAKLAIFFGKNNNERK